ncbi:hypothetical protein HY404_03245 [Candidatus Microgenomates bacterium]|nr:hypothetical protein [Candidatus Microgenomates bacterium]
MFEGFDRSKLPSLSPRFGNIASIALGALVVLVIIVVLIALWQNATKSSTVKPTPTFYPLPTSTVKPTPYPGFTLPTTSPDKIGASPKATATPKPSPVSQLPKTGFPLWVMGLLAIMLTGTGYVVIKKS